jgi:hypothetical protein
MPAAKVGWRLWAALVASLIALGAFAHFAYGASFQDALMGVGTTMVILLVVIYVAHLSGPSRSR